MYCKFRQNDGVEIVWIDEYYENIVKLLKEYQENNVLNYDYLDDFLFWLLTEYNIQSEYFKYDYDIDIRVKEVE